MSTATVRILFLHDDENAVQETTSLLRNAGINAHGHRVADAAALGEALGDGDWALLVFSLAVEGLDRSSTLRQIRQADRELPVVLLDTESALYRITEGLQAGASDVILAHEDDEERLLLVVQRELRLQQLRSRAAQAEAALAEAEKRCELLLETSRAAIAYVHDGMHVYVNGNYLDLFGYGDADDLAGIPFLDLVSEDHAPDIRELFRNLGDVAEGAFAGRNARGQEVQGQMVLTRAAYEGEPCVQVLIRPPVTGHQQDTQITRIQTTDPLTGLPNRQMFLADLERRCRELEQQQQTGALLFVIVDGLTALRTREGFGPTDELIAQAARMLEARLGEGPGLARLTDDAFALTLTHTTRSRAEEHANAIRKAVEDHLFELGERTVRLTASIAATMITSEDYSASTALARTHETATRLTGPAGASNSVQFYEPVKTADPEAAVDSPEAAVRKAGDDVSRSLVEQVRQALTQNTFQLFYQPIISLRGDDEELYEVFVRLPTESGQVLRPMDFLPAAEQVGIAGKVDRWIVLQSIKTLSAHRTKGHNTRLIINLTYNSLADKSFLPWLTVAIKAARLPSDAVIFQISEDDATTYLRQAKEFTRGLTELHCRASLSHFGKSVNPFGTLRHLNVELVKVDGSLVENLEKDPKYKDTLSNTISSLQSLGKLTIVPMVETATLLATLWQAGANYIQGHYLQEPTTEMDYDFGADDA